MLFRSVVLVNAQVAFQIEIKGLRTENNNLKASVAALALKATNDEKRTLFVYQSAINAMTIGAPGFAGAWDKYLKEAHAELERVRDGQIPFIQKWFNRAKPLQTGTSVTSIENDSDR